MDRISTREPSRITRSLASKNQALNVKPNTGYVLHPKDEPRCVGFTRTRTIMHPFAHSLMRSKKPAKRLKTPTRTN